MTFKAFLYMICFTIFYPANGCGSGSQVRTLTFTVTNFTIPSTMAYSDDVTATSLAPFISTSEQQAVIFAMNLVEKTVEDVLYQQGREAGLSYDVISLILQQFDIKINYKPLKCDHVYVDAMGSTAKDKKNNCEIKDNGVTNICDMMRMCHIQNHLKGIPSEKKTISGTIETSNFIMANWSRQMWTTVLNRAVRRVASGQFSKQFSGATATID